METIYQIIIESVSGGFWKFMGCLIIISLILGISLQAIIIVINILLGYCNIKKHGVSLPTKDEAVNKGFNIANEVGYNYRSVLRDNDNDLYYSGWMDCFDWINGNFKKNNK